MDKLSLDASMREKLNGTDKQVELVDEDGKTLGFYVLAADHARLMTAFENEKSLYKWANAQVSDEELAKSMQDNELYTTAEVLAYLETL
jgi:hypothetical protein